MKFAICFTLLSLVLLTIEALPQYNYQHRTQDRQRGSHAGSGGYRVRCNERRVSNGVWDFNCDSAPKEAITLNLEHHVDIGRSELGGNSQKEINVVVPNYLIKQTIHPQLRDEFGNPTSDLTVNIALEKPQIKNERGSAPGRDPQGQRRWDSRVNPSQPHPFLVNVEYQSPNKPQVFSVENPQRGREREGRDQRLDVRKENHDGGKGQEFSENSRSDNLPPEMAETFASNQNIDDIQLETQKPQRDRQNRNKKPGINNENQTKNKRQLLPYLKDMDGDYAPMYVDGA